MDIKFDYMTFWVFTILWNRELPKGTAEEKEAKNTMEKEDVNWGMSNIYNIKYNINTDDSMHTAHCSALMSSFLLSTPMSMFQCNIYTKTISSSSVNGICLTQFQINVIEIVTYRTQFDFLDWFALAMAICRLMSLDNWIKLHIK